VAAVTTRLDYYALLGVEPDATAAQIKKAYRTLARQHHPDHNPGDLGAAARFRNITEAYDTLSDPRRREAYDRTRPPVTSTTLTEPAADIRTASLLVQVLEETWLAIRRRHPEIPAVVIIVASGTETRQPRWGPSPRAAGTSKLTSAPKS
jgi:curved DNA-binding protein CbpA